MSARERTPDEVAHELRRHAANGAENVAVLRPYDSAQLDGEERTRRLGAFSAAALLGALIVVTAAGTTAYVEWSHAREARADLNAARANESTARAQLDQTRLDVTRGVAASTTLDLLAVSLAHLGNSAALVKGTASEVNISIVPAMEGDLAPLLDALLVELNFGSGVAFRMISTTARDGALAAKSREGRLQAIWTNVAEYGLHVQLQHT
jgi:hypothetical protein